MGRHFLCCDFDQHGVGVLYKQRLTVDASKVHAVNEMVTRPLARQTITHYFNQLELKWRPKYDCSTSWFKPKFHYSDIREVSGKSAWWNEFGLKGTSRVCRGRHGEVGIVEFGLYSVDLTLDIATQIPRSFNILMFVNDVLQVATAAADVGCRPK